MRCYSRLRPQTFDRALVPTRREIADAFHLRWADGVLLVPGFTCILHPASFAVRVWTAIMLALVVVYVAFLEPVFIAFNSNITSDSAVAMIDLVSGAAFAFDVLVNFRSGIYYVHEGHCRLVLDGNVVSREYLSRFFAIDFVSAVPFFVQVGYYLFVAIADHPPVVKGWAIVALRAMRLLRVVRLWKIFSSRRAMLGAEVFLMQRSDSPVFIFLLTVIYWFAFFVNLLACAFIYTATTECFCSSWVVQLGKPLDPPTLLGKATCGFAGDVCGALGLQLPSAPAIYVSALYFATMTLTTVGYGDIVAKTLLEKSVVIVFMLAGAFAMAMLTARIIEVIAKNGQTHAADARFKDKMVEADLFGREHRLAEADRQAVLRWVQVTYLPSESTCNHDDLLSELPLSLRATAIGAITGVHACVLGDVSPSTLTWLLGSMQPLKVNGEHYVVLEGEPADQLFFTVSGALALLPPVGSAPLAAPTRTLRGKGLCVGGAFAAKALRGDSELVWPVCVQATVSCELFSLSFTALETALRLSGASAEDRRSLAEALERLDALQGKKEQ